MNLRDVLNSEYGDPIPDPVSGREDYLIACAFVKGYEEGKPFTMATSTNGRTMQLHNLSANTRSALILRDSLKTKLDVETAVRAQLDAMSFWVGESNEWGRDPWPTQGELPNG